MLNLMAVTLALPGVRLPILITFHVSRITLMNTNFNSTIPAPHSLAGEGTAVGLFTAALLLAKRLFAAKPPKPEPMSRADFYAELVALKDQIHAGHLAILEKLDANHRELLAALERQGARVNTLESGLARVDERTRR
jgi:hypothetical protein